MWQMGGFGPMLGQAHHFIFYAKDKIDYAVTRYGNEANRLYGVLDRQLEGREYVADEFSIADIAIFPWTRTYERQHVDHRGLSECRALAPDNVPASRCSAGHEGWRRMACRPARPVRG